jgi:Leucine-rich repeat (LRR) protein
MFSINYNRLESIPKIPISLKYFYASTNYIINFNNLESAINLLGVDISKNNICELPNLANCRYLQYFNCSKNKIKGELKKLPDNIKELNINSNHFNIINELPSNLIILNLEMNQIKILNLPKNLKELNCSHNPIEYLHIPNKLRYLNCEFTNLKEIPLNINKLKKLECIGIKDIYFIKLQQWITISKFKKLFYYLKFGKKLEYYYIKNVRNKKINLELLYSPDLDFYKMKWNQVTLKYI